MAAEGKTPGPLGADDAGLEAPLQLRTRTHGLGRVVELVGSLHGGDEDQIRTGLARVIQSESPHVVLDLSALTFIVSAGLSALISAHREARRLGGGLRLAAARPNIANLLRVTRLNEMFDVHPSLEDALATLPMQM